VGKYQLSRGDLVSHLEDQLIFLSLSGRAFDEGVHGEAKRLATVLRVLVHDTGSSTSLLTHLGVKERLSYVDTAARIQPGNLLATPGLVMMEGRNPGTSYVAPLDNLSPGRVRPNVPFHLWWEGPVTKDRAGHLFSRRDYVLTVANKEGGAHVDHLLDERYKALAYENSLGFVYGTSEDDLRPVELNPAYASVRQIAFEIERTVEQHRLTLGLLEAEG
jgi:hypothetical protein